LTQTQTAPIRFAMLPALTDDMHPAAITFPNLAHSFTMARRSRACAGRQVGVSHAALSLSSHHRAATRGWPRPSREWPRPSIASQICLNTHSFWWHEACSVHLLMKLSNSGRFVVLETLRIDRLVLERLAAWAAQHDLQVQDAIQVAVCAFNDGNLRRPTISREGSGSTRPAP
jgi:hypothetical protein